MNQKQVKSTRGYEEMVQALFFLVLGIGLILYSLTSHFRAQVEWVMSPYLFPTLIAVFMILLSISLFVEFHRANKKHMATSQRPALHGWNGKKLVLSLAAILAYYFAMPWIGFVFSGILFLIAMFWLLGERRIWLIAVLSSGTSLVLYGLFHELLHVMLP